MKKGEVKNSIFVSNNRNIERRKEDIPYSIITGRFLRSQRKQRNKVSKTKKVSI